MPADRRRHRTPTFKEYGALKVVESWRDDVPEGEVTSFPMAVQCKPEETIVFGWTSREARNEDMAKVREGPRMSHDKNPMPFDGERAIHGGFEVIVER